MLMKENGRNSCNCFASVWGEMYETALSFIGAHIRGHGFTVYHTTCYTNEAGGIAYKKIAHLAKCEV